MPVNTGYPGATAIASKGRLGAHKWLLLRRFSQLSVLGLFLSGPWLDLWLLKGNLASSLILDTVPLSDPLVLLQGVLAGNWPLATALIGAGIVLLSYLVLGGRVYCSWVCPVNPVTDAAQWLRERLKIKGGTHISRQVRYWLLGGILVLAVITGTIAWELINPVSMVFRGLVFGMGLGWVVLAAIFILDLLLSRRAWCGSLCPVGAFYGLIGELSLLRISASRREQCDDCMDCFTVCPEQQVIRTALKGEGQGIGPVILAGACSNCARCIDVCAQDVFHFDLRFNNAPKPHGLNDKREVLP